jgi:phage gpG-like protein
MPGLFDVKVRDLGLRERLKKAGKLSTANLRVGMESVGRAWLRLTDEGFKQERDPFGNPWQPLATRTIRKKAKLGYRRPSAILQASGQMRKSFAFHATSRSVSIYNTRAAFPDGTDASIHQFGGQGEFQIPSRPMVPFQDELPDEWFDAAQNNIRYAIGRYME